MSNWRRVLCQRSDGCYSYPRHNLRCHLILSSMATQTMSTRSSPASSASRMSHKASKSSNGNSRPKRSLIQRLNHPCQNSISHDNQNSYIKKICGRTSISVRCFASSASTLARYTSCIRLLLSTIGEAPSCGVPEPVDGVLDLLPG